MINLFDFDVIVATYEVVKVKHVIVFVIVYYKIQSNPAPHCW